MLLLRSVESLWPYMKLFLEDMRELKIIDMTSISLKIFHSNNLHQDSLADSMLNNYVKKIG